MKALLAIIALSVLSLGQSNYQKWQNANGDITVYVPSVSSSGGTVTPIQRTSLQAGVTSDVRISNAIAALFGGSGIVWVDDSTNQTWAACPTWGSGNIVLMLYPVQFSVAVNCTIPVNIGLVFNQGAMLCPTSGTTLTILGNQAVGITQIYCNAIATQGTISFAGNKAFSTVYPEWWGTTKSGGGDLPGMQACSDAADTFTGIATSGATVQLGLGTYAIGSGTWKVGSSALQHHINIVGVNMNGTLINANTSAGGTAIYLNDEKYITVKELTLTNSGAKGGEGIQFGGDGGGGTQTSGLNVQHVTLSNFTRGADTSGGSGTSSEIIFDHCVFSGNTYGFYSFNFNALNFLFQMLEIYNNTTAGLHISDGNIIVNGGASSNNGIDFDIGGGNDGTAKIIGFRAETPVNDWLVQGSGSYITIEDCIVHPTVLGSEVVNIAAGISIKDTILGGYIFAHVFAGYSITLDNVSVDTPGTDWSLTNQLSSATPPYGPGFRISNNQGFQANALVYLHNVQEASNSTFYPDLNGVFIVRPSDNMRVVVGIDKGQGAVLTLTSNTLAPYAYMHHVNDAGLMKNLNPVAGFGDQANKLILIPDQAFTTDTTGNIGKASTAIVGQPMIFTKDLANNKWYPSY